LWRPLLAGDVFTVHRTSAGEMPALQGAKRGLRSFGRIDRMKHDQRPMRLTHFPPLSLVFSTVSFGRVELASVDSEAAVATEIDARLESA